MAVAIAGAKSGTQGLWPQPAPERYNTNERYNWLVINRTHILLIIEHGSGP